MSEALDDPPLDDPVEHDHNYSLPQIPCDCLVDHYDRKYAPPKIPFEESRSVDCNDHNYCLPQIPSHEYCNLWWKVDRLPCHSASDWRPRHIDMTAAQKNLFIQRTPPTFHINVLDSQQIIYGSNVTTVLKQKNREIDEQQQLKREKNRIAMSKLRANLTDEQRQKIRDKERRKLSERAANLTDGEQRQIIRDKSRIKMSQRTANLTGEQRQMIRDKNRMKMSK